MLMRFEPFRELDRITEELLSERRVRQVPVDAYRRGNELKVNLDLPSADPGSIELTVERDVLTVRATRTWQLDEGDEIQVAERAHGQFSRYGRVRQRCAHDHHSGGRAGQAPQGRDHPRGKRGRGRRGSLGVDTKLVHGGWSTWLKGTREGITAR